MRIIAGSWRGRPIAAPATGAVRPTADRVREALFSMIASRLPGGFGGIMVLDLFCGTGALGLEALSRGAAHAIFIDNARSSLDLVACSLQSFGAAASAMLLQRDAAQLGASPQPPAGLVFADPPYGRNLAAPALTSAHTGGWIAPGALICTEIPAREELSEPPWAKPLAQRRFGKAQVLLWQATV